MKNLVFAFIVITFFGCMKNRNFVLSHADQMAFDGMNHAYDMAFAYNDSMRHSTDSAFIHYCDEKFHEHEGDYNSNHDGYDHEEGHSDHDMSGGMMSGGCCGRNNHDNNTAHHSYHHDQFDGLLEDHQNYHP